MCPDALVPATIRFMFDAQPITSAANPRIKAAMKLRRSRDRRGSGLFIAEGHREVSRAITAGLELIEAYLCEDLINDTEAANSLSGIAAETPVFSVPESLMKMLAYRDKPEGVLAVVRQPVWSANDLRAAIEEPPAPPLLLVAVGTQKPGNLGAMVRTAEAAGCVAVIAAGAPVDIFNPNAIRASTCAVYTLPVINMSDDDALAHLRDMNIQIAATTPAEDTSHYTDADLTDPLAVVIGPEDMGLGDAWLDAADIKIAIPTLGRTVDSLNAANAAAVVLFEAVRQRTK